MKPEHDQPDHEILRILDRLRNDQKLLEEAAQISRDAATSVGCVLKDAKLPDVYSPVPVTLFPSLVPQPALREVVELQKDINLMMHRISHDKEFLTTALSGVASVDPFIRKLLDIYLQVDPDSHWELEFIRSDYLLHCDQKNIAFQEALSVSTYKQVEVNMICIAFAGLSSKMPLVHHRVLNWLNSDIPAKDDQGDVLALYGGALSLAQSVYGKYYPPKTSEPQIVLTVIHETERNTIDQKMIEFESGLICLRRTFKQIAATAKLENGRLFVEGMEVAVVYYRTGYAPVHYEDENDWNTRLQLEKSHALKCPSVAHQLSGFKKIQQELSKDDVLKRFVSDDSIRKRLLNTCVGQWDISSPESSDAVAKALKQPELFVLKPNREGGGNNFYGDEMISKIQEVTGTDLAREFILMERIVPPFQENYLVKPGHPAELASTISEIGVFGVLIAKNEDVLFNLSAQDVLVRSKASNVDEGGVATGYACLSSAFPV